MKTQRLNYCTQAAESLTVMGIELAPKDEMTEVAACARDILILLSKAEKFILPEWGRIFTNEEWVMVQDVQYPTRLPYPIIALEYPCPYTMGDIKMDEHETRSSKRIALAVEYEALVSLTPSLRKMAEENPAEDKLGYYIMPIAYADDGDLWTPPPAAMFMPRRGNEALVRNSSKDGVTLNFITAHLAVLPLGRLAYKHYPAKDRIRRAARDIADEALAICHLMTALSLDKGRHETLPAPEKLNRKRSKKGKPPLYEYKVLDIVADVLSPPKEGPTNGRQSGHHASPRMHSRRGHVRKLASGKATWIRNTIVGKPGRGTIIKDYSVHE